MKATNAVVRGVDLDRVLFQGSYKECIMWMSSHRGWIDLRTLKEDGTLGRFSTWVL